MSAERQATLFELGTPEIEAAAANPQHSELAQRLPRDVRLGTMSWSFAGWRGIVYGRDVPESMLAARGLEAYGRHPLLGAVEIRKDEVFAIRRPSQNEKERNFKRIAKHWRLLQAIGSRATTSIDVMGAAVKSS